MDEIGNILYSIISAIGKEKIQTDITLDIHLSRQYIQMISAKGDNCIEVASDKTIDSLCEALLHFMLTACTLPSVRNISTNNIELHIVIPDLHTLRSEPAEAIVIQIPKEVNNTIKKQLKNVIDSAKYREFMDSFQKTIFTRLHKLHSWIRPKCDTTMQIRNFHDIIVDINLFLEQTMDRSIRFFH